MCESRDEIEQNAMQLFIEGQHELLLTTWQAIPKADRLGYPNLAYQTAKIYTDQGNHPAARENLQVCIKASANQPAMQARAYLQHAQLAQLEHDFESLRHFIAEVEKFSKDERHQAECQFLLGEFYRSDEPDMALFHFDAARRIFLRRAVIHPESNFDVARASIRAADVAFEQNMRSAGWMYQHEAEQLVKNTEYYDLRCAVLIRSGEAYEREGNYDKAALYFKEAQQYAKNPAYQHQLHYNRARLAIYTSDDKLARQELDAPIKTNHRHTLCQHALIEGWLHTFRYEFDLAKLRLKEIRSIQGDNRAIIAQADLLEALIMAQQGTIDTKFAQQTVDFLLAQRLYVEANQAQLVLAWMYALKQDHRHAQLNIQAVEAAIKTIGHSHHLTRLFQVTMTLLGGWWHPSHRDTFQHNLAKVPTGGVVVMAFGTPRIILGDGNPFQQRDRYQYSMRMLLYMLEERRIQVMDAIEAVWGDERDSENAQSRFRTLMSSLTQQVGDWYSYASEHKQYVVKDNFPYYYDVQDFNDTYEQFLRASDPLQRMALCFKLIGLYKGLFAKTIQGDIFDDYRTHYQARLEMAAFETEERLPEYLGVIPKDWHSHLTAKLREILS